MLDLAHASRADLMRVVLALRDEVDEARRQLAARDRELGELRAAVAALTEQVGRLTAADGDGESPGGAAGMPGPKPAQAPERAVRPRKRRAVGAGRRRMPPTRQEVHALASCPACGAPLAGGSRKRSRAVIDPAPPRIVVTEHAYVERRCPDCGKRCVPPPALAARVTGRGRVGHGLTSLIGVLREEARLPVRTIQSLLQTLTGLRLSVGAIVAAGARLAERAEPTLATTIAAIRAGPVVHLDETGWREDGRNGYVWTASTAERRLFVYGTRQKGMVDRLIGAEYAGVVVSDFYAAYTGDDRVHRYCWAHLLRDIDEASAQHPADAALRGWAAAVRALFRRAQEGATGPPAARRRARTALERELGHLRRPWLEPRVAQTPLCARILKHLESLFVFVTDPAVPATNNAAERSLRHLVTIRKISGGTRSPHGTATRMTLAGLFGTWRAQGINPFVAAHELLTSPQL